MKRNVCTTSWILFLAGDILALIQEDPHYSCTYYKSSLPEDMDFLFFPSREIGSDFTYEENSFTVLLSEHETALSSISPMKVILSTIAPCPIFSVYRY